MRRLSPIRATGLFLLATTIFGCAIQSSLRSDEMTSSPHGFLVAPESGTGPGVLLLHAWWGLNDTMKQYARDLAGSGFVVLAPDLYDGKIAETIPEAETLSGALDERHLEAKATIERAVAHLVERSGQERVAVVGFSLGGYYALHLAGSDPDRVHAVVLYYGCGDPMAETSKATYLGHFAENDPFEPSENVEFVRSHLEQAGRPVSFHQYDGVGHWFAEPDREDAYDPQAAGLAWTRTLDFLKAARP